MFYIRADANKKIATGHVMRCMSIADEMKERNIKVCFLTADHNADDLIQKRGFDTICLDSKWDDLESELADGKLISLLKNTDNLEGILVDTYYVTEKYLEVLHNICRTVYIDDIFALKRYPVDFLINYNIYGEDLDYKSKCLQETKLLLGSKYVPLRKEFQNLKPVFREKVKNIFISTGGTDNFNIAGRILDEIFNKVNIEKISVLKDTNFHVISGAMNVNLPHLLELRKEHKNIFVYQNTSNMSDIMLQCDIAISACGSTMYEICACGLPIITYSFADNQLAGIKKFEEEEIALNCGDIRQEIEQVIWNLIHNLEKLNKDFEFRKKFYRKISAIVDGEGAKRIVEKIVKIR